MSNDNELITCTHCGHEALPQDICEAGGCPACRAYVEVPLRRSRYQPPTPEQEHAMDVWYPEFRRREIIRNLEAERRMGNSKEASKTEEELRAYNEKYPPIPEADMPSLDLLPIVPDFG